MVRVEVWSELSRRSAHDALPGRFVAQSLERLSLGRQDEVVAVVRQVGADVGLALPWAYISAVSM